MATCIFWHIKYELSHFLYFLIHFNVDSTCVGIAKMCQPVYNYQFILHQGATNTNDAR